MSQPQFDPSKITVFFIHGYTGNGEIAPTTTVTQAYLTNGNYNIVALDWGPLAAGLYTTAVENVILLGTKLAQVLIQLNAAGLDLLNVHLVGHSLGGQMSGWAGSQVQTLSNNTLIVGRISPLDPAGPLFWQLLGIIPILVREVTPQDGKMVDCYHSDAGYFGEPNGCGQVDIWPNSGTRFQPGCPVVGSLVSFPIVSKYK